MEVFSNRLKELRNEQPLEKRKQTDVAKELGISAQSYSTYENGREPNYELLCKISKYFNVSIDYLLGQTNIRNFKKKEEQDLLLKELKDELETTEFNEEFVDSILNKIYFIANCLMEDAVSLSIYKESLTNIFSKMSASANDTYSLVWGNKDHKFAENAVLVLINSREKEAIISINNIFEVFSKKASHLRFNE